MPDQQFLQSLPELDVLAQIAKQLDTEFRLRGSVARNLARAQAPKDERRASLFDFVSAFSDIDLVAADDKVARIIRSLVHDYLPYSRFFHWDIRTSVDIERYDGLTYIGLEGQAEIAFGGKDKPATIRCLWEDNRLRVEALTAVPASPRVRWSSKRASLPPSIDSLVDLLYLARQFPELLGTDAARRLRKVVRSKGVLDGISQSSPKYQRLLFGLLKALYSEEPQTTIPTWFRELCAEAAERTNDHQLRTLLRYHARQLSEPRAAVVRPEENGGRWVRKLYGLQELGSESDWRAESTALAEALRSLAGQSRSDAALKESAAAVSAENLDEVSLSPIATLVVEGPPDPGCCRYRDFSRGVVEIVWRNRETNMPRIASGFVAVDLSSADQPLTDESAAFAHAYAVFGTVGTMRIDYGFLSTLAGSRRPIKVMGFAP